MSGRRRKAARKRGPATAGPASPVGVWSIGATGPEMPVVSCEHCRRNSFNPDPKTIVHADDCIHHLVVAANEAERTRKAGG